MKSSKKTKFSLSALLALFFLAAPALWAAETGRQEAAVKKVLSGDRVLLEGGKTLRYTGLEAPPLQHLLPLVRQYGEDSRQFNRSLVEGKKIQVEWAPRLRDANNDLLGYVFLEDGTFVNREILKTGHAKKLIVPPNTEYAGEFRHDELDARRAKKGLWKEEPDNPFIKSEYVGEKNTKIFYFPDSPELSDIPAANLVTFRSRVEAKAAGYRACPTCREKDERLF